MSYSIGGITAERGEKKTGFLEVAEQPLGKIALPITIINGKKTGPTLFISAGIHAVEYPGIRAAQIISQSADPTNMTGTVIVLQCANPPMFNAKTAFVNPIDNLNFNRIFPGNPTFTGFYGPGTSSHHITNQIYEKIMKKSTHFIDLHGGDLPELVPFFASSSRTGDDAKDKETEAILKYTLADYISLNPPSESLSTTGAASRAKIPNTLIEAGGAGLLKQSDIKRHVNGVENIMKYLGITEGKPVEPKNQKKMGDPRAGIRARRGGFFTYLVNPGEIVQKEQVIGLITDIFGQTLEEIKSPIAGIIVIINFLAAKSTGDPLFSIRGLVN